MTYRARYISSFCFLTLVIAAFLFNAKFSSLNISSLYFGILAIIFFGVCGHIRYKKLSSDLVLVVAPLYIAFILAIVSYSANFPEADYFLCGALLVLASIGLCSFGFFSLFSTMCGQALLVAVISALSLNAILMLLMFISPAIQNSYLSLLTEDSFRLFGGGENALESLLRFRMIGATGFAAYSTGFAQSIGLFFLAVYYYVEKKKLDLLFLLISVLLAVSAVIAARSSFLGIFLWVIFCFIFFRWRFALIFSCSSIFLVIVMVALVALIGAEGANFFTNWLLELFTSGSNSESLAETIQMLDIPFMDSGFFGFSRWFGDLGYDYFRSADVGYIRVILAGGFVSLFLVILHFLLLGLVFFRGRYSVFFRTLYCFLMAYFFAIMFKGAILFDFFAFDFLMLMLGWIGGQTKELAKIE
jgi:hypothetical protein